MNGPEAQVLGAIMEGLVTPAEIDITEDDFTKCQAHSLLYKFLKSRYTSGLPTGREDVLRAILKDKSLKGIDAMAVANMGGAAIHATLGKYVLEVKTETQHRILKDRLGDIHLRLEENRINAYQASVEVVSAAVEVRDLNSTSMDQAADDLLGSLEAVADGRERAYLTSGIPEWDDDPNFMGVSRQGMTIIMGRSGMGKTSILNCMATGMLRKNLKVYFHGTETDCKRRLQDMAFSCAGVDARQWALQTQTLADIRAEGGDSQDIQADIDCWYDRVSEQVGWLRSKPLCLTGTGLTVEQVCAKARQLHAQGQCDVVFIDYLQTLKDSSGLGVRLGDMQQQTGFKSGMLCQLAADLGCPVIIGAQVSGEKQGKAPEAPAMWDVQHSSKVHQDAEIVLAIHRPDYFREREPGIQIAGPRGQVQVVCRKTRSGVLGTLNLKWDGPTKWVGDRRLLEARPPDRLRLVD